MRWLLLMLCGSRQHMALRLDCKEHKRVTVTRYKKKPQFLFLNQSTRLKMEFDLRKWNELEIGCVCPPSYPPQSRQFLFCPHPTLNWDMAHRPVTADRTLMVAVEEKKAPSSRSMTSTSNNSIWQRGGLNRALSVELLKFTLEFYEAKQQPMTARRGLL